MMIPFSYGEAPPAAYISTLVESDNLKAEIAGSIFTLEPDDRVETLIFFPDRFSSSRLGNAPLTLLELCLKRLADEDEDAPPTEAAVGHAVSVSKLAISLLGPRWVAPRVATDGFGGVRLSWRSNGKELRAVISGRHDRDNYLYWQDTQGYKTLSHFTPVTLYSYLDKLIGGSAGVTVAGRLSRASHTGTPEQKQC